MTPREKEANLQLLTQLLATTRARRIVWSHAAKEREVIRRLDLFVEKQVTVTDHKFTAVFTSGHEFNLEYTGTGIMFQWSGPDEWWSVMMLTDELYDVGIDIIDEIVDQLDIAELKDTEQTKELAAINVAWRMLWQQERGHRT